VHIVRRVHEQHALCTSGCGVHERIACVGRNSTVEKVASRQL